MSIEDWTSWTLVTVLSNDSGHAVADVRVVGQPTVPDRLHHDKSQRVEFVDPLDLLLPRTLRPQCLLFDVE